MWNAKIIGSSVKGLKRIWVDSEKEEWGYCTTIQLLNTKMIIYYTYQYLDIKLLHS